MGRTGEQQHGPGWGGRRGLCGDSAEAEDIHMSLAERASFLAHDRQVRLQYTRYRETYRIRAVCLVLSLIICGRHLEGHVRWANRAGGAVGFGIRSVVFSALARLRPTRADEFRRRGQAARALWKWYAFTHG